MGIKRHKSNSRTEYTVSYSGMHGVDFSPNSSEMKRYRFSHLENMYRDYEGGGNGITESIPGFRAVANCGGKRVNSIFSHKDSSGREYIIVHAETGIYRFPADDIEKSTPLSPIITAKNTKSCAFCHGSDIYILDGEKIIKINGDGAASSVAELEGTQPYIPTTYINGEEYEQRNLLTNKFYEKYNISSTTDHMRGSEDLQYKITSTEERLCAVSGIAADARGLVYIPSYVSISGIRYKVTEISDKAFYQNQSITEVIMADSITRIGQLAFYMCNSMRRLVTSNSIIQIDNNAMLGCSSLSIVYLGAGLKIIGAAAFDACPSLTEIHYSADSEAFGKIIVYSSTIQSAQIIYNSAYTNVMIEIPVFSPVYTVREVRKNGTAVNFMTKTSSSGSKSVLLAGENKNSFEGAEITIYGTMDSARYTKNSVGTDFMAEKDNISGFDAITKCTVCESFDGRVFLSGNPALPNTVFYSSRDSTGKHNPLYFGVLNYFNDGIGSFGVQSMLASGDSLAVFKSGDDGCGSIYYHYPKETGADIMPIIYPVSYVHSGIHAVGESISFFDDPIFLSSLGVTALNKKNINSERSISVRSHNINTKLLSDDLSKISMTKWCGYLVVCAGEHIYLADSRDTFMHQTNNLEYEWYYLSGIGTHTNDRFIYKYSMYARDGYDVHPDTDATVAGKKIYMTMDSDNKTVIYEEADGKKYEVHVTGERTAGTFYPATVVYSTSDNLLFFGTECGDVCVFNNDKRGEPPPDSVANMNDEEKAEYRKKFARQIHPAYYSFNAHAPRYALSTASDNGGFPHFEKNTVKNSLTAKIRMIGSGKITCESSTDKNGSKEVASFEGSSLNFGETDFSDFTFSGEDFLTLPFKEREKGWTEKSISFYTNEYEAPFGICNISYRFNLKGKIKN